MNHFLTSAFVAFLSTCVAGAYFVFRRQTAERFFGFFWLTVAFWTFFVAAQFQLQKWMSDFLWGWFLHLGCVFVPALFLHFVLHLTRNRKRYSFVLKTVYLAAATFTILNTFTDSFTGEVIYRDSYTYPKPAIFYPLYILYFQAIGFWTLFLLIQFGKKISPKAHKWLYLFLAVHLLAYLGSMDNYLIMYDIRMFPIYPYGLYLILPYAVFGSYAIVKLQTTK